MFARLFGGGSKQAAGPSTSSGNTASAATINAMQVRACGTAGAVIDRSRPRAVSLLSPFGSFSRRTFACKPPPYLGQLTQEIKLAPGRTEAR